MEPEVVVDLKERAQLEPDLFNGVYFDDREKAYVIGIIDPLTGYNFTKSVEYGFKKLYQNGQSCVPPDVYAQRFQNFMAEAIQTNAPQLQSPMNADRMTWD